MQDDQIGGIVQFRNILIYHLHEELLVDVRKLRQDILYADKEAAT